MQCKYDNIYSAVNKMLLEGRLLVPMLVSSVVKLLTYNYQYQAAANCTDRALLLKEGQSL